MWRSIVAFELRQQLRSPAFAVVSVISALLVFGSVTTQRIRIGPLTDGLRNGPEAILQIHGVWSLFFAFTAVAFATDAVLRDEQTRFAPVLYASPLRKAPYLWGRFAGAFAAVVICFLSVPAGLLAASFAPWVDPAALGPMRPEAYAFALLAIALPNLFLLTAVVFALAVLFRSAMAGYLGAVALLAAYGVASQSGGAMALLLEPLGFVALREGGLLVNRLLWTGLASAALLAAYLHVRFEAPEGKAPAPEAASHEEPPSLGVSGSARFDRAALFAQFSARTRWELRSVLTSAPFRVVAALGAFSAGAALWAAAGEGADTTGLIARLIDSFRLVPMTVAIFYAGELVWAERDAQVQPLTASTPAPDAVFLLPKLIALTAVLLGLLAATAFAGAAIDALHGDPAVDVGAWLAWYVLPRSFDWLVFAALAFFLQTVSPSKLAGWGWMVLFLISSLTLETLGLHDGLYRYGGRLDVSLAELRARDPVEGSLLRLYWGAFALLLATLAYALHGRGEETRLRDAGRQAWRRLRGPAGAVAVLSLLAFAAIGVALARDAFAP